MEGDGSNAFERLWHARILRKWWRRPDLNRPDSVLAKVARLPREPSPNSWSPAGAQAFRRASRRQRYREGLRLRPSMMVFRHYPAPCRAGFSDHPRGRVAPDRVTINAAFVEGVALPLSPCTHSAFALPPALARQFGAAEPLRLRLHRSPSALRAFRNPGSPGGAGG